MNYIEISIPKEVHQTHEMSVLRKTALGLCVMGVLVLCVGAIGLFEDIPLLYSLGSIGLLVFGGMLYAYSLHREGHSGLMNEGTLFRTLSHSSVLGWVYSVMLMGFYCLLYFEPSLLRHCVASVEGLSHMLRNRPADHWFFYGIVYSVAVFVMGLRFLVRYRHSRYQVLRTVSVLFFQVVFAVFIPAFLELCEKPGFYFHYFWPLKKEYLFPSTVESFLSSAESIAAFMGWWAIIMSVLGVPVLTYYFGKRWYCSWVCGCGALAETMGDPFRHLSSKSMVSWRIERWLVHGILVWIVAGTVLLWVNSAMEGSVLQSYSAFFSKSYGFLIGSIFSGVIGTGFYPLMGARVWCRFGCPQAAILGIVQRYFSRFRITTNGGQCISCGQCSTYCEMGIDVRSYAQRERNIVRASCVGCGVCASVCPRGVLTLENSSPSTRENV